MKMALLVAGACVTLFVLVAEAVIGRILQEEAVRRLGRIPFALVSLASARLPRELREEVAAEWRAELDFALRGADGRPLTRLLRGIRYAAGLLMSAPAIADSLRGSTRRLLRIARAIGAAGTTAYAIWLLVYSYDYFQPHYGFAVLVHGWTQPIPGPSPDQWTMTGVSYICAAAGILGTALVLATGYWLIANLNVLCFVAAGVLSFTGGGPLYSIVVASAVFCILVASVPLQARARWSSRDATRSDAGAVAQKL
jgi:hypothetical protein